VCFQEFKPNTSKFMETVLYSFHKPVMQPGPHFNVVLESSWNCMRISLKHCIIVVDLCQSLNRIVHIHAQCVHSWAIPLIGSFLSGVYILWHRESESDRNIIFRFWFIGYFVLGFHIVASGYVFLMVDWYKRERTSKHSAIWLILGLPVQTR
jgi:hypothetical protein